LITFWTSESVIWKSTPPSPCKLLFAKNQEKLIFTFPFELLQKLQRKHQYKFDFLD
jgi:hypothetical protein